MKHWKWIASAIVITGCTTSGSSTSRERVAENDLGVTWVEVNRTMKGMDPVLEVRGLNDGGEELARLELRTGLVRYSSEPGMVPEVDAIGTELVIWSGDVETRSLSPDLFRHELSGVGNTQADQFLHLSPVAAELDTEAGIVMVQRDKRDAVTGESAYWQGRALSFPSNKGVAYHPCEDLYGAWHMQAEPAVNGTLVFRDSLYDLSACRNSNGTTGCVDGACYFGACGFHPNGTQTSAGKYPWIGRYTDEYQIEWCQAWFNTTNVATPYSNVTGTCTCTGCNSNGTPTPIGCHNDNQ